jgi:hypothetical protein
VHQVGTLIEFDIICLSFGFNTFFLKIGTRFATQLNNCLFPIYI